MRTLVTGGAGFIGSHLVDALISRGDAVLVLDNLTSGRIGNLNSKADLLQVDVGHSDASKAVVDFRPDVIFHLAAQASVGRSMSDPLLDLDVNVKGTLNLAVAGIKAGVSKFVFSSSAAVYGNPRSLPIKEAWPTRPLSPYGLSKLTAENYLELLKAQFGLNCAILRYSNVYGPRQTSEGEAGVIAIFADRAKRGQQLEVFGDGEQTRDFVHVSDVVAANLTAWTAESQGPINISAAQPVSLNTLCTLIGAASGRALNIRYSRERAGDIRDSALDNSLAAEVLGWRPRVTIDDGLRGLMAEAG